jgi:O-antigen/teichoic acid export membrane protein
MCRMRLSNPIRFLIKTIEHHLQTDMVYLLKGGSWLTLRQLANGVNAFVLSWVFAHWLSSQTLGTFRYLISAFEILSYITLTGLDSAALTAVAQKKTGFVRVALKTKVRFGFFAFLIAERAWWYDC